jgi:hypothetical protein
LFVDDEAGCEVSEHLTNLENPSIACGVTFEDGTPLKGLLGIMLCLMSLKLELLTVHPKGTEVSAKGSLARRRSASGGYMLLNCKMGGLGRFVPIMFPFPLFCPIFL